MKKSESIAELWRPVKGYEGIYEVSNYGNLKSLSRTIILKNGTRRRLKTKILKPISLGNYHGYQLTNSEGTKKHYIHRLVCKAFIGEPIEDNATVNHKDGNKYNNKLSNLEWSSYSDNLKHAYRNSLNKHSGERHHYTKFSDEIVSEVREKYSTGKYRQSELAALYGISRMQIHRIVKFKNRKIYVKDDNK